MLRLFGGDSTSDVLPPAVPGELASVVLRCVRKTRIERPHDGRQLLDAFTRVVRKLWGTAYRPLTLPKHGPRSNSH
jgi:hypothetical protein